MSSTPFAAVSITALLFFTPNLAQAQAVSSMGRIGGGGGVEQVPAGYAEAVQKRQDDDAKIRDFNRKRDLEEIDQYNLEHGVGAAANKGPVAKANAGELAAEKARAEQVAKQIEANRKSGKKGPSAEFLATQARFNDAAPAVPPVVIDKGPQTPKPMTAQQQELLKLELAECQRSGRTPDQLTPAEIAALKVKAGVP